jgi:hypothetical protein
MTKNMPDDSKQYHTEDIILILSKLPEFLRKSMMRSRLQEFCTKDSKTREEFIDSILGGLSTADKDSLKKVIRTWLGVVSTLESSEISTIFSPYIKRYEKDPSLCESEYFAILLEAYQLLEENQRAILRDCLVEVVLNQHRSRWIVCTLPKKVRSALQLR